MWDIPYEGISKELKASIWTIWCTGHLIFSLRAPAWPPSGHFEARSSIRHLYARTADAAFRFWPRRLRKYPAGLIHLWMSFTTSLRARSSAVLWAKERPEDEELRPNWAQAPRIRIRARAQPGGRGAGSTWIVISKNRLSSAEHFHCCYEYYMQRLERSFLLNSFNL